jgi:DNA replication and repair protein RecF
LALKLATYLYLKDRVQETPILLLDDVFAELDNQRTAVLAELLASDVIGQSIITIAEIDTLLPLIRFNPEDDGVIRIENGSVDHTADPPTEPS